MGYETFFELYTTEDQEIHRKNISKMAMDDDSYLFDDMHKWYNYQETMIEYSKKYPDILFTLYGDGEDSDDKWVTYFKNGKLQFEMAKIIYPDFDENKLVELDEEGENDGSKT